MATITITKGPDLPDSAAKSDFYALVSDATVSLDSGTIVNADISNSAAIADSKLAQITTASKVSGAAITSLANIPSGAGQIPVANAKTIMKKTLVVKISAEDETPSTGDGKVYVTCPTELNGMDLTDADASLLTAGTGTTTVMVARGRRSAANGACTYADMLSTAITIDTGEYDSANAATAPVIDTSNDDIVVSTYVDMLRFDVDGIATGAKGLEVRLSFTTP